MSLHHRCLVGVALLFGWGASPLLAQRPTVVQNVPPDTKPYAAIAQGGYFRTVPAATPQPARAAASMPAAVSVAREAPPAVQVAVTLRQQEKPPVLVDIRGPDGKLRTFRLEGGNEVVKTRTFPVRPGETVTVSITPTGR